jgi:ADP-ribose pyrophosphatase YjhB (NUDIX family)
MEKIKAYGVCVYKRTTNGYEILLCKSVKSEHKWGCLKGVRLENETPKETALREFTEESSIKIDIKYFEEYFYQENETKDIGIYLYNSENIENFDSYFNNGILEEKYLSSENSQVKFFNINELPPIKVKQTQLIKKVIGILTPN